MLLSYGCCDSISNSGSFSYLPLEVEANMNYRRTSLKIQLPIVILISLASTFFIACSSVYMLSCMILVKTPRASGVFDKRLERL
mmetsp:Transcript_16912/g.2778  ORF Transcript_16912/g.2778 Transcript_16912/m.2778 type:complete len:84 (-) Transcript_16912:8199-8450(-)